MIESRVISTFLISQVKSFLETRLEYDSSNPNTASKTKAFQAYIAQEKHHLK